MPVCLWVDPCGEIQPSLQAMLTRCGLAVDVVLDVHGADVKRPYVLIVIDMRRRPAFGNDACTLARQRWQGPVLAFIDPQDAVDKVLALEMGADALVMPPFSTLEIEARLRSLLRRSAHADPPVDLANEPPAGASLLEPVEMLDTSARRLRLPGARLLNLSASECLVLQALIAQKGHAVSRGELLARTGLSQHSRNPNIVDLAVSRLRRKLVKAGIAAPLIETVRGQGYSWQGLPG